MLHLMATGHHVVYHWMNLFTITSINPLVAKASFSLSQLLKTFRNDNHYCQKEVASKLGITREYYWRIENEKDVPSLEVLLKICKMSNSSIEIKKDGEIRMMMKKIYSETCDCCNKLSNEEKAMIEYMIHKCRTSNSVVNENNNLKVL